MYRWKRSDRRSTKIRLGPGSDRGGQETEAKKGWKTEAREKNRTVRNARRNCANPWVRGKRGVKVAYRE